MIPDYLYHYTNINALAAILKTRKIRFTRLDFVNDTTEGDSTDFGKFSQYMFVSCWTDLEEENLVFWNMYTKNMSGVRIKFKFPIVKTFNNYEIIDANKSFKSDHMLFPNLDPITKVEYTNDHEKLRPSIMIEKGLEIYKLGKYKAPIWSIESEWRYLINIIPLRDDIDDNDFRTRAWPLIHKRIPPNFTYYDFEIDQDSFDTMEVTIGPKSDFGDKVIIESLVNTLNPKALLNESGLTGKIR